MKKSVLFRRWLRWLYRHWRAAAYTILTFDDLLNVGGNPIGNGQLIDQDYGDRVTGLIDAAGSYGVGSEGFTPNVVVDYGVRTRRSGAPTTAT